MHSPHYAPLATREGLGVSPLTALLAAFGGASAANAAVALGIL